MTTQTALPIVALLTFLLSAPELFAGSRRRVVAASLANSEPAIVFLNVAGNVLDTGRIAWNGQRLPRSASFISRTVTLRVGERVGSRVALLAALPQRDPGVTVRINGTPLGLLPVVVATGVPTGVEVTCRIDIEVSRETPEGTINSSIDWEVREN